MSDLENFSYIESANTGSSAESFRLFQERMKAASAQIQAIRAGERKQRKKEDQLAKILASLIVSIQHDSAYGDFLVYVSKLLALNVPASFILVLLIINFPHLQEESGLKLLSFKQAAQAGVLDAGTLPDISWPGVSLPPSLGVAVDSWIMEIAAVGIEQRQKLLEHALDTQGGFSEDIKKLTAYSLNFYLNQSGFMVSGESVAAFSNYFLSHILSQIKNPSTSIAAQN